MKCPMHGCRHWNAGTEDCDYCRLCKGLCHDSGHRAYDVYGAELKPEIINGEPIVVCREFERANAPVVHSRPR